MIMLPIASQISPIYLTVTLIIYLTIVELGHEKLKKVLFPLIFVLIIVFLIIAGASVYSQITH